MTSPQTTPTVHVRAPGRIAVWLRVGAESEGARPALGVFQAVSLHEEVRARPDDDFSLGFAGGTEPTDAVPTDGTNTAVRAAMLLARRIDHRGGVRLEIAKNLPVGGGLGGAAADAAAALVACDALWGAGLGRDELMVLAAELGDGVPFALAGGTAIGAGREAAPSPALAQGRFHWVLVVHDDGVDSADVLRELDRRREGRATDAVGTGTAPTVDAGVLRALRAGDARMLAAVLRNDLQAPAVALSPALGEVIELGEENGALAGIVSGSGPTLAFLAADRDAAIDLQIALSAARHRALHVTGPVHGARVVAAD